MNLNNNDEIIAYVNAFNEYLGYQITDQRDAKTNLKYVKNLLESMSENTLNWHKNICLEQKELTYFPLMYMYPSTSIYFKNINEIFLSQYYYMAKSASKTASKINENDKQRYYLDDYLDDAYLVSDTNENIIGNSQEIKDLIKLIDDKNYIYIKVIKSK